MPSSPPPLVPRVAFVCHSGYFTGRGYGGAMRASMALMREARRICGSTHVDVIASVQTPVPDALVFRLEGGALGELEWEGMRVLVGRRQHLLDALRDRTYDIVISLSVEHALLALALDIRAGRHVATPHNYYLPPFGPFRRFDTKAGHPELLARLDALLSPCEHHCDFLQRWGPPGLTTRALYAADYRYFHTAPGGALPPPMAPWEASHRYVTFVSPSPEKGLPLFVALARRLPTVAFAAVPTQWTSRDVRDVLAALPNVTLLDADPDVDVIFRRTRLLLAPSIWQECCPLIVMEACARGVPCVSSDVFGLPEANANPRLVCRTSLCYDHARGVLHHGVTNAQLEARLGATPPPLPAAKEYAAAVAAATRAEATEEEARPFVETITSLLGDEALLKREAAASRDAFLAFARERQDGLRKELEGAAAARREKEPRARLEQGWPHAVEAAAAAGYRVRRLAPSDVLTGRDAPAAADEPAADELPTAAAPGDGGAAAAPDRNDADAIGRAAARPIRAWSSCRRCHSTVSCTRRLSLCGPPRRPTHPCSACSPPTRRSTSTRGVTAGCAPRGGTCRLATATRRRGRGGS